MKPTVKITSLLLAVLMLFTAFASGCTLNKEWSYKTSDKELAIGVYLTAMQEAYAEAQTYAAKEDDYDETSDKWLDMEITDNEGNKQVAKDWIKDTAERKCLELLVLEPEIKNLGATVDEASISQTAEQYETSWVGQDKAKLEKHGVSVESYKYFKSTYNTLRDQLFDLLYGEGGSQAVAAEEIKKYLTDNYARYMILPVSLHESTTDEAGEQTEAALSADAQKKITDALDGYVKTVNAESDAAKAAETADKLLKEFAAGNDNVEETSIQSVTLFRENPGITDKGLEDALKGLEEGKAVTVKVGKEDKEASYFFLFRYNSASMQENYQTDGVTDKQVLQKMKSKDFTAYLKTLIDKSGYQKSSDVDKYEPKIFFEKPADSNTSVVTA